ncbi:MAG: KGG domain-containing protein [Thermoanaerobaculia bacterium]
MANTSKRGFASMDAAKQRDIASKGGRAAHAKGTAHEFTTDEARVAGRKGGEAVSRDRQHMSTIGREGGHSRGARARAASQGDNAQAAPSRSGNDQPFERPTTSDRGIESSPRTPARDNRPGTSSLNERSTDSNRRGPFVGRDEI